MNASRAAIDAARLHPSRVDTGSSWWTPEEWELVCEKVRTVGAQPDLQALRGAAAEFFAGAEPDLKLPLGGWHVGFTQTPEVFIDELRLGYPYPDRLIPFLARVPLSRLQDIEQQINSAADEFQARGMSLYGTDIDVASNQINLYVDSLTDPEWVAARFDRTRVTAGIVPGDV